MTIVRLALAAAITCSLARPALALRDWSETLPADQRFQLVLQGEGVLDKETGLVWTKKLFQPSGVPGVSWLTARTHCLNELIGGRKGWRLPTFEELATLVDLAGGTPALPQGHPFDIPHLPVLKVWSATAGGKPTATSPTPNALVLDVTHGVMSHAPTDQKNPVWCVRGGYGPTGTPY